MNSVSAQEVERSVQECTFCTCTIQFCWLNFGLNTTNLYRPYTFLCKLYVFCSWQVHVNGLVSLDYLLYPSWWPYLYPSYSFEYNSGVIAPFWADIDLRYTDGVVYVGHFSRSYAEESVTSQAAEVFETVSLLVLTGAGDTGFLPTEVVTVTWQNVRPYPAYYYLYESQVGLRVI